VGGFARFHLSDKSSNAKTQSKHFPLILCITKEVKKKEKRKIKKRKKSQDCIN